MVGLLPLCASSDLEVVGLDSTPEFPVALLLALYCGAVSRCVRLNCARDASGECERKRRHHILHPLQVSPSLLAEAVNEVDAVKEMKLRNLMSRERRLWR